MKKRIGIIGATGSVGSQAVEVILGNSDLFETVFVTAHSRVDKLNEIKSRLGAKYSIITSDKSSWNDIINIINDESVDLVLFSASGVDVVGLVYKIVRNGTNIALANKESIVTAGAVIMEEAKSRGVKVIPVDSEHSAIFQCLSGQKKQYVDRITLTASGGPFRKRPGDAFDYVNIDEAMKHPSWSMGSKITVDSATMMNKGLELIEAKYLFDVESSKLEAVIHPECIIHSLVTFSDGVSIAQMGLPDMKTPISFALGYPERINSCVKSADLCSLGSLSFFKVDEEKFKCYKIAKDVLNSGSNGLMTAMNAANEVAVKAFLEGLIQFNDIWRVIDDVLSKTDCKNAREISEAEENIKKAAVLADETVKRFTNKI